MSEGLQAEMTLQESCLDAMRHMSVEVGALIDKTKELEDENAKLREELTKWERLTAGIDIPEYPVTQFEPKDLERENVELRKLVCAFDWCTENFDMPYRCDQCPLKQTDTIEPECEILMRKLGIKEEQ